MTSIGLWKKITLFMAAGIIISTFSAVLFSGARASAASACPTSRPWTTSIGYKTTTPGCIVGSSDKKATVLWQKDGNLVFYISNKAVWASNTAGKGALLSLQTDGNIVIYNAKNVAVWASSSKLYTPSIPFTKATAKLTKALSLVKVAGKTNTYDFYLAQSSGKMGGISWTIRRPVDIRA